MYNQDVFKANQPFIKVVSGENHMPMFNKFGLPYLVDAEVRRAVIDECAWDITRSFKLYAKAKGEAQLRQYHHALVTGLEAFCLPSQETLSSLEVDLLALQSYSGKKRKRLDVSELQNFSDQLDLLLDVVDERISTDKTSGGASSNEDLEIDPEHPPVVGQDGEETTGASDLKLYVLVKRGDEYVKKLVAVAEFKFVDRDAAGFQGACYACEEAPVNTRNAITSPIYIVSFSEMRWTYSILHVRGQVCVEDGVLQPSSLADFWKTEASMGSNNPVSGADLVSMLEDRTKLCRQNCSDAASFQYPDGRYLVGTLYKADRWRELPSNSLFGADKSDVHHFYAGLLRIIIGDSVLNWNKEMITRVSEMRKKIRMEEKSVLTGRFCDDDA